MRKEFTLPDWFRPTAFAVLGALAGWGWQYWSDESQRRLDLLRASRRDAYVGFQHAQAQDDPAVNTRETTEARKRIAIYGNRTVAVALARYWREHFHPQPCAGPARKDYDDIAIYQAMRSDIMPGADEAISDADMTMLVSYCTLGEPPR